MPGFELPALNTRLFARNTWYEMACDPGAMAPPDSGKSSFTVPGSPSWNKTFYERGSYDGENTNKAIFADAQTAKPIMLKLLEDGFSRDSGSVKILKVDINLWPVKQRLEKEEDKKATKAQQDNDFWSGSK